MACRRARRGIRFACHNRVRTLTTENPRAKQPKDSAKGDKGTEAAGGAVADAAGSLLGSIGAAVGVVVVLHGAATNAALDGSAYKELTGRAHPHVDLMKKLKGAGVKFLVCGQSLARKGYDSKRVRSEVTVAASAVTATVNLQIRGFAYMSAH